MNDRLTREIAAQLGMLMIENTSYRLQMEQLAEEMKHVDRKADRPAGGGAPSMDNGSPDAGANG